MKFIKFIDILLIVLFIVLIGCQDKKVNEFILKLDEYDLKMNDIEAKLDAFSPYRKDFQSALDEFDKITNEESALNDEISAYHNIISSYIFEGKVSDSNRKILFDRMIAQIEKKKDLNDKGMRIINLMQMDLQRRRMLLNIF